VDPASFSFVGEKVALLSGEAYVYDIYAIPTQRGRNLASILNADYTELLHGEGVSTVIGVVDAFNRSSLNYVRKVGCIVRRKNLYLNLFGLVKKIMLENLAEKNQLSRLGIDNAMFVKHRFLIELVIKLIVLKIKLLFRGSSVVE